MRLEVCANSYRSAINAQNSGADRIELCSELAVGGITPSFGLIKQAVEALKIPVFVLIRPRSGNFTYSKDELEIMEHDILQCKTLGCSGIVSGVLHKDNTIDVERTRTLIELAKPLPFTFHRAFDWVENPQQAIGQLIEMGAERVLTSGQETSAFKGITLLNKLKTASKDKLTILPGGGINADNAKAFKDARFSEIHCSASTKIQVIETPKISMNSMSFFDERLEAFSDAEKISKIKKAII